MPAILLYSLYFGHVSVLPFTAVSLVLILTTIGASYLPARRASRIDPLQALREQGSSLRSVSSASVPNPNTAQEFNHITSAIDENGDLEHEP